MGWIQLLLLLSGVALLGYCNYTHTRRSARRLLRQLRQELH